MWRLLSHCTEWLASRCPTAVTTTIAMTPVKPTPACSLRGPPLETPLRLPLVCRFRSTGCLGITLSYHRQLSHRSFATPKWLEYALAYCGVLAAQGDPIEVRGRLLKAGWLWSGKALHASGASMGAASSTATGTDRVELRVSFTDAGNLFRPSAAVPLHTARCLTAI